MSLWTALLVFPVQPGPALRRARGSRLPAVAPVVLGLAIFAFFSIAQVAAGDAWACALTYARYAYATAAGGTVISVLALRVAGCEGNAWNLFGSACLAAAWTPFAFVGIVVSAQFFGAGPEAGVYAGLAVLVWGAAAGMAILAGDGAPEPGRLLVGTCLLLSGCLAGFWAAHRVPPAAAVNSVPSPIEAHNIKPGNMLLVRTESRPRAPCIVLLREPGTPEAVFAHLDHNGARTILGDVRRPPEMFQDWNIAGRVFFRFGGSGGWSVLGTEQTPQPSQD